MKRFNCPKCGRSLWLRLLPFVQTEGQFRFSCLYCGALLAYNARQPLISGPHERLTGSRLRSLIVFPAGVAVFSFLAAAFGRAYAFTALAVVALIVIGFYLFSPRPAYKIADGDNARKRTDA